jgi:hypothetical protein
METTRRYVAAAGTDAVAAVEQWRRLSVCVETIATCQSVTDLVPSPCAAARDQQSERDESTNSLRWWLSEFKMQWSPHETSFVQLIFRLFRISIDDVDWPVMRHCLRVQLMPSQRERKPYEEIFCNETDNSQHLAISARVSATESAIHLLTRPARGTSVYRFCRIITSDISASQLRIRIHKLPNKCTLNHGKLELGQIRKLRRYRPNYCCIVKPVNARVENHTD